MSEKSKKLGGWVSVFRTSTDYEADMARDRLDSAGIPAAVFTQRDHALNLTVGALARVYVMVQAESVDRAEAVLRERLTDEELEAAAGASDTEPGTPTRETEQLLDSGIEKIHFETLEESSEDENLV
ncbi:MAG: putative signal transducing protein [Rhodothermia bacterium]